MLDFKLATKHLIKDKILKKAIKGLQPLELPATGNVYNELVKAIVYQQISYKAADTIYGRFVDLLGSENFLPQDLMMVSQEDLKAVGFSTQKARYVHNIAEYFLEQKLYEADWSAYSDSEIIKLLTEIKGVGAWTVNMMLIFQLGRPDILPLGDLAIRQVMIQLYQVKSEKKELRKALTQIAEPWRPYRTIASLYLWSWKRENPS